MLCFFHDDLDGRCSAAIVRRAAGNGRFVPAMYHRPLPLSMVDAGATVVIVDYSLSCEDMQQLRQRAGRIVWIDHHASALANGANKDLDGMRASGRAACELTWQYYFPALPLPRAVALTGDRDVWTWRYGEETAAFCEGIRLVANDPEAPVWQELLDNNAIALNDIVERGHLCRRYQKALAAEFIGKYGFAVAWEGKRCYAANLNTFGSDVFGDLVDSYDICICFVFDGARFNVTLYSQKFDVLPLALRFGGGGHHRAAGFVCDRLPFTVSAGA